MRRTYAGKISPEQKKSEATPGASAPRPVASIVTAAGDRGEQTGKLKRPTRRDRLEEELRAGALQDKGSTRTASEAPAKSKGRGKGAGKGVEKPRAKLPALALSTEEVFGARAQKREDEVRTAASERQPAKMAARAKGEGDKSAAAKANGHAGSAGVVKAKVGVKGSAEGSRKGGKSAKSATVGKREVARAIEANEKAQPEEAVEEERTVDRARPKSHAVGRDREAPSILPANSADAWEPGSLASTVKWVAAAGLQGSSQPLPYAATIQKAFGRHDISRVQAHLGGSAAAAARALGAHAYAAGEHIAFDGSPDLHTAAHEAAHVVQQRHGVQLPGGVGQPGDPFERHADAVADLVVRGQSAQHLLDGFLNSGTTTAVQLKASGAIQFNPVGMLEFLADQAADYSEFPPTLVILAMLGQENEDPKEQVKPKPKEGKTPTRKYKVKKGDNLTKIAKKEGVQLGPLIQANPQIKDPNLIYPNQIINVPVLPGSDKAKEHKASPEKEGPKEREKHQRGTKSPGAKAPPENVYIVHTGDNLTRIARHHHVTLKSLIAANPQIKNPNLIHPGDRIVIPGKPGPNGLKTPPPKPVTSPTTAKQDVANQQKKKHKSENDTEDQDPVAQALGAIEDVGSGMDGGGEFPPTAYILSLLGQDDDPAMEKPQKPHKPAPTPPKPHKKDPPPKPDSHYIIKRGDTLWAIARKHGIKLRDLEKANPQIRDYDVIYPGQKINLPGA